MATSKTFQFNPVETPPEKVPVKAGGPGRTYSEEQLTFFKQVAALKRDTWYDQQVPVVVTFVKLLRSAAEYLNKSRKDGEPTTGVTIRTTDPKSESAGLVQFKIGERGKARGKGAAKAGK